MECGVFENEGCFKLSRKSKPRFLHLLVVPFASRAHGSAWFAPLIAPASPACCKKPLRKQGAKIRIVFLRTQMGCGIRFFYVSGRRGTRLFAAQNAAARPAAPMLTAREVFSTFPCRRRGEQTGGRGRWHRKRGRERRGWLSLNFRGNQNHDFSTFWCLPSRSERMVPRGRLPTTRPHRRLAEKSHSENRARKFASSFYARKWGVESVFSTFPALGDFALSRPRTPPRAPPRPCSRRARFCRRFRVAGVASGRVEGANVIGKGVGKGGVGCL